MHKTALFLSFCALTLVTGCATAESSSSGFCEARWYSTKSENPACYDLQLQLVEAASLGDVERIEELVNNGANVNGGAYQSLSALSAAASIGHERATIFLLRFGAEINRVQGMGHTALKSSVASRHRRVAQLLLENGADVCEDHDGSALDEAIQLGDQEMVDLLIRSGAADCG